MFFQNRIVRFFSYLILYMTLTSCFVIWRFPIDDIKPDLEEMISKASDFKVKFGSLRILKTLGISGSEIYVLKKGKESDAEVVKINEAVIKPSLFSLLRREPAATFDLELLGGTLDGEVSQMDDKNFLFLNAGGLKLNRLKFLDTEYNVQISGTADAEVKLLLNPKDFSKTTGNIDLKVDNAKAIKFPMASFLAANKQPVHLGKISGKILAEKSDMKIKQLSMSGNDMEGLLSGSVKMRKRFSSSKLDIEAKLKPKGNLEKKAGMILNGLKPKGSDGYHVWKIKGTLGNPRPK